MILYLDASFLVALFTNDAFTEQAEAYLGEHLPTLIVSDFGGAEFSSAIARRVRMKDLTAREAHAAFASFDAWAAQTVQTLTTTSADVVTAQAFLRRLDLILRTPDALNIALAQRAGATLATFDEKMAAGARSLGIATIPAPGRA